MADNHNFRIKNGLEVGGDVDVTGNINNASGNLTLDVAGDIILDAGGGDFIFKEGGTENGRIIARNAGEFVFYSAVSDEDIKFKGNDGGSTITALTLDMSAAGAATFNSTITATGGNSTNWNTAFGWGNHASQSYATQSYVGTQISNLVDSSPAALNTLNELAAAIGDDASFSTTVTNNIATKLPLAGGTLTGTLNGVAANFSSDVRVSGWLTGASDTNTLYSGNSTGTIIQTPSNTNDAAGSFYIRDSLGAVHFTLNTNTNVSTFAGTISSGAITSTGILTLDTSPASNGTGDLRIIPSLNLAAGVGYAGQVLGVNIATAVHSTHNAPAVSTTWGGVTGAAAIALQADDNSYGQFQVWTAPQDSSANDLLVPRFWINGSGAATMTGVLTINNTNDLQLNLTSPSSWTGIGFNDSAAMSNDYIWHNGTHGTFAIGGGGSNVANKKLHVDGGMTIGSSYDSTAVTANSLNVQGTVTATGGNSGQWNTAYGWGNHASAGYTNDQTAAEILTAIKTVDGSGSGLDADLLDGVSSASFLRSDADDSFTGGLASHARDEGIFGQYSSTQIDHIWSMGTAYKVHSTGANFGNLYGLAYKHTNNTTGGTMGGGHQIVWANSGTPRAAIGYDRFWHAASGNLWGSSNDGAGSGLDADLLDGVHGASFLRSDAADTATGEILFDAGFKSDQVALSGAQNFDNLSRSGFYNLYNTSTGSTNSPGFPYGTLLVQGSNKGSGTFVTQTAYERTGTQYKIRGMNDSGSTWYPWQTIWTSGTDGSGSGLDADSTWMDRTWFLLLRSK